MLDESWKRGRWIFFGLLAAGALLDSLSNALALVTPALTYWGSGTLLLLTVTAHVYMRLRGVPVNHSGWTYRVNGLGSQAIWTLVGVILLLWYPRARDYLTGPQLVVAVVPATILSEESFSERYARALDQLGSSDARGANKIEVRVGAITELGLIAQESARYHWPIMEVLCTYLREHAAGWKRTTLRVVPRPEDWDAIVRVLRQRDARRDGVGRKLDLTGVQLYRADLRGANLSGANLTAVDLFEADLSGADLHDAVLAGANLRGANFLGANLQGAFLGELDHVDRARLDYIILDREDLRGANFSFTSGLSRDALRGARIDSTTILPDDHRSGMQEQ